MDEGELVNEEDNIGEMLGNLDDNEDSANVGVNVGAIDEMRVGDTEGDIDVTALGTMLGAFDVGSMVGFDDMGMDIKDGLSDSAIFDIGVLDGEIVLGIGDLLGYNDGTVVGIEVGTFDGANEAPCIHCADDADIPALTPHTALPPKHPTQPYIFGPTMYGNIGFLVESIVT